MNLKKSFLPFFAGAYWKPRSTRSGHWFATYWHWFHIAEYKSVEECNTSFTPFQAYSHFMCDHSRRSVNRVVQKGVKGVYTAMVKYPFKERDRVDTFCTPCRHGKVQSKILSFKRPVALFSGKNYIQFNNPVLLWFCLRTLKKFGWDRASLLVLPAFWASFLGLVIDLVIPQHLSGVGVELSGRISVKPSFVGPAL